MEHRDFATIVKKKTQLTLLWERPPLSSTIFHAVHHVFCAFHLHYLAGMRNVPRSAAFLLPVKHSIVAKTGIKPVAGSPALSLSCTAAPWLLESAIRTPYTYLVLAMYGNALLH